MRIARRIAPPTEDAMAIGITYTERDVEVDSSEVVGGRMACIFGSAF